MRGNDHLVEQRFLVWVLNRYISHFVMILRLTDSYFGTQFAGPSQRLSDIAIPTSLRKLMIHIFNMISIVISRKKSFYLGRPSEVV